MESVFHNNLLMSHICSFANSIHDLRNLRLTSRALYHEATPYLRCRHRHIKLTTDSAITSFVRSMENRLELETLPYSAFSLDLENPSEKVLKVFAASMGQHVKKIKCPFVKYPHVPKERRAIGGERISVAVWKKLNLGPKVAALLSNVPNLQEFYVETSFDIHVNPRDKALMSPILPNLKFVCIVSHSSKPSRSLGSVSLNSVLLDRSAQLHSFELPLKSHFHPFTSDLVIPDLTCLRSLPQHKIPKFVSINEREEIHLSPMAVAGIQELTEMNLRFKSLFLFAHMGLDPWSWPMNFTANQRMDPPSWVKLLVKVLWEWLSLQSECLENLEFTVYSPAPTIGALRFPTLRALTQLTLEISDIEINENNDQADVYESFRPIYPFVKGQFPCLTKLHLKQYKDYHGLFSNLELVMVRELVLECQTYKKSPFMTDPWERIVPNLRSLELNLSIYQDFEKNKNQAQPLSFVLTHLAYVTELRLHIYSEIDAWEDLGLWNILTGGASRPENLVEILTGNGEAEAAEIPVPVDGIYEKPSLANLRNLKKLVFQPGHAENLEALVYLTRRGLMVPLEKVCILHKNTDEDEDEDNSDSEDQNTNEPAFQIEVGLIEALAEYHSIVDLK